MHLPQYSAYQETEKHLLHALRSFSQSLQFRSQMERGKPHWPYLPPRNYPHDGPTEPSYAKLQPRVCLRQLGRVWSWPLGRNQPKITLEWMGLQTTWNFFGRTKKTNTVRPRDVNVQKRRGRFLWQPAVIWVPWLLFFDLNDLVWPSKSMQIRRWINILSESSLQSWTNLRGRVI